MELDPVAFVLRIDQAESVAAETVHVPVRCRDAAVAHDNRVGQAVSTFWLSTTAQPASVVSFFFCHPTGFRFDVLAP
jgi:hypothetical protein